MKKLKNKNMKNVNNVTVNLLKNKNITTETITFDNG